MDRLIQMLIESSIAIALFYGYYHLFLRKETFFVANRLYLLFTALVSILIPWITISLQTTTDSTTRFYNLLETVTVTANGYETHLVQTISGWQWASLIYVTGALVMGILLVVNVLRVVLISKKAVTNETQIYPSNVVLVDKSIVPFSFLNRIYINVSKYSNEQVDKIIAHELVHIRQRHTFDCLFYELLLVLFWFHPMVYRYRTSAKENHEFLADEGVLKTGINKAAYQELLFAQATGLQSLALPNSFNYSLIKRRLIMLKKIKSSKIARTRYIWSVPVLVAVLLVFACNKMEKANNTNVDNYTNQVESTSNLPAEYENQMADSIYSQPEIMAEFPGGQEQLIKYIMDNVKYPEVAKEKGIQGKVFVQFVVDKKGKVCEANVVRGVQELLDKEALRVVNTMPDWKPGMDKGTQVKVQFTIPINFRLE